jgi:hypothetical protein
MYDRFVGVKQIDDVIAARRTGGNRWIKYRDPRHRGPIALPRTALHHQAGAQGAEAVTNGIGSTTPDKAGEHVILQRLGLSLGIVGQNGL